MTKLIKKIISSYFFLLAILMFSSLSLALPYVDIDPKFPVQDGTNMQVLKADITAYDDSIFVEPSNPDDKSALQVGVKLKNIGNLDVATSFSVEFRIYHKVTGAILGPITDYPNRLEQNQEMYIKASFGPVPAGKYDVRIFVDAGRQIVEENENNNVAFGQIEIDESNNSPPVKTCSRTEAKDGNPGFAILYENNVQKEKKEDYCIDENLMLIECNYKNEILVKTERKCPNGQRCQKGVCSDQSSSCSKDGDKVTVRQYFPNYFNDRVYEQKCNSAGDSEIPKCNDDKTDVAYDYNRCGDGGCEAATGKCYAFSCSMENGYIVSKRNGQVIFKDKEYACVKVGDVWYSIKNACGQTTRVISSIEKCLNGCEPGAGRCIVVSSKPIPTYSPTPIPTYSSTPLPTYSTTPLPIYSPSPISATYSASPITVTYSASPIIYNPPESPPMTVPPRPTLTLPPTPTLTVPPPRPTLTIIPLPSLTVFPKPTITLAPSNSAAPLPTISLGPISKLNPDLIVDSLTYEPAKPKVGDKLKIIARIKNIGEDAAGTFKITSIFRYEKELIIYGLKAGESLTREFIYELNDNLWAGGNALTVIVDRPAPDYKKGLVEEKSENNNEASTLVIITAKEEQKSSSSDKIVPIKDMLRPVEKSGDKVIIDEINIQNIFVDVPKDIWFAPFVKKYYAAGILDKGNFRPGDLLTRGEAAKMLACIRASYDCKKVMSLDYTNAFADIAESDWYFPFVNNLFYENVVTGSIQDGVRYFKPNEAISRDAALKMILSTFDINAVAGIQGTENNFKDLDPKAWYQPFISYAVKNGLVKGYEDGTFRPEKKINRAEFIKMVAQIEEHVRSQRY